MSYNTDVNPCPPGSTGDNIRSSYNMNPIKYLAEADVPKKLPIIHKDMEGKALYTDNFIKEANLNSRHVEGINSVYVDGSVKWINKNALSLSPLTAYGNGYSSPYQTVWDEIKELY